MEKQMEKQTECGGDGPAYKEVWFVGLRDISPGGEGIDTGAV